MKKYSTLKNTIETKQIDSFNHRILSLFIDNIPLANIVSQVSCEPSYTNLWSAWLLNDAENDSKYIWTLLKEKADCNLPILLCPDDMDFWCTIIVAKVRFYTDTVVWHDLGIVNAPYDIIKWRESGIQNISSWSEDDWVKYGDTLPFLGRFDKEWPQWWSEHWQEEENRRIWNYFHPFFNDDKNIHWFKQQKFIFAIDEYLNCVNKFKYYQISPL